MVGSSAARSREPIPRSCDQVRSGLGSGPIGDTCRPTYNVARWRRPRTAARPSRVDAWRANVYDRAPERTDELFSTISGIENEPLSTPETRRGRLRPRPRLPGRVSVHARRLPVDVSRAPVDDAPVRRLRHGGGDERALPVPLGARPDRALDRLRHAHADGLRLRSPALARRGRPRGRRGRLARRHGAALRAASRSATSRRR